MIAGNIRTRSTRAAAMPSTCAWSSRGDAEPLQAYFRSPTTRSRYNRFLGAMKELPSTLLEHFTHVGEAEQFSAIATMMFDGYEAIVGEVRYAFHAETSSIEFGLSIDDRWQRHGIGKALLKNLRCRAASFGAERIFGDTLRSNEQMVALARKAGYAFTQSPGDWKLLRFEQQIDIQPREIPCASWKLAALSRQSAIPPQQADRKLSPVLAVTRTGLFSVYAIRKVADLADAGRHAPLNTALRFSTNACTASL
jgi:RimJ/RimL family protein N-acetyltransferase